MFLQDASCFIISTDHLIIDATTRLLRRPPTLQQFTWWYTRYTTRYTENCIQGERFFFDQEGKQRWLHTATRAREGYPGPTQTETKRHLLLGLIKRVN